jgi:hypothetical protein
LIQHILDDWRDKADAFFLFANSTTVDFYPKFGFAVKRGWISGSSA